MLLPLLAITTTNVPDFDYWNFLKFVSFLPLSPAPFILYVEARSDLLKM